MKRVCIVRQDYFPSEAHVYKNVKALASAGYKVDVICLRGEGEGAREPYAWGTIYRLPIMRRRAGAVRYAFEYLAFAVMAFLLLSFLTLRKRYRIVEVYNLPDFLVLAAVVPKLLGARVILYLFDMMPELVSEKFNLRPDGWAMKVFCWLERRSIALADRAIAVGPHDKAVREERGTPAAKLAVVMNVPDEELFGLVSPADTSDETFRLITHGSILKRYGIQTLIGAVPYLRGQIPNLEVTIVGAGEYTQELQGLVARLGIEEQVRFAGWVPIEEMAAYISRADVGVVPILSSCLMPSKLFEYAALGKPVVASAAPTIQAVFPDEAVLYFEPGNEESLARGLLTLYRDAGLRARLAARAQEILQQHSWQRMRQVYVEIHDELMCRGRDPKIE
jgi:glycosyltransferase involved in cell wall biosynthesis